MYMYMIQPKTNMYLYQSIQFCNKYEIETISIHIRVHTAHLEFLAEPKYSQGRRLPQQNGQQCLICIYDIPHYTPL